MSELAVLVAKMAAEVAEGFILVHERLVKIEKHLGMISDPEISKACKSVQEAKALLEKFRSP